MDSSNQPTHGKLLSPVFPDADTSALKPGQITDVKPFETIGITPHINTIKGIDPNHNCFGITPSVTTVPTGQFIGGDPDGTIYGRFT